MTIKSPPLSQRPAQARTGLFRTVWLGLGLTALAAGAVGVILPVLPTTPFVLLAAFCFAKGSPRLRHWLLEHRVFGPIIRDWERHGAIATRYKVLACGLMCAALIGSVIAAVPMPVLGLQLLILSAAASYILTRPSGTGSP